MVRPFNFLPAQVDVFQIGFRAQQETAISTLEQCPPKCIDLREPQNPVAANPRNMLEASPHHQVHQSTVLQVN